MMPVALVEKEASTELVETEGGSLYSTEARRCPGGSFQQNSEQQPPGETLPGCSAVHPSATRRCWGAWSAEPARLPWVWVGEHSRKMRGDKGQGPCPPGPGAPGPGSPPPRGPPPARAAPAPPAEGPACPRAAPPPPCLCACRGAEEELAKFWAKNPPFCCQPSPTSGAAVRRAGLRTRPPHKGSSSAPLRSAPGECGPGAASGSGPHPRAPRTAAPPARRLGDGRPGPGERRPPVTSPGRRHPG